MTEKEGRIYIPDDMLRAIEALRVKFGDEKISQTARRIIRLGIKKLEEEAA